MNPKIINAMQLWDASTGRFFSQYREHQKRAWSVDFSHAQPTKFATGSDDCTVKLWSINDVYLLMPSSFFFIVQFINYLINYLPSFAFIRKTAPTLSEMLPMSAVFNFLHTPRTCWHLARLITRSICMTFEIPGSLGAL